MRALPVRLTSLAAAAALLGPLAIGCGEEPTPPPAPPTPAAAEAIPTAAGEMNRLIFAHPEDATKLDPADVTDGESLLVTWHIYEGLTRYRAGGSEVEPSLATKWEVSSDGLVWTFTLREGVKFHDGTDFNADAVVWNFNRWFDPTHPAHFQDASFEYWADMFQGFKGETDADGNPKSVFAGAEAVDPQTVKLTLNRSNAPLLQTLAMSNFAFSSPQAIMGEGADDMAAPVTDASTAPAEGTAAGESAAAGEAAGTEAAPAAEGTAAPGETPAAAPAAAVANANYGTPDGEPIAAGTGPYRVKEWDPDARIVLEAFPDYWGDAGASAELEFRVIPDGTARFLALSSGEIDGMNQVNPEDIATAEGDTNLQVVFEPANNVGYLGFNQARAPWGNLDCRLAVAHAIDKQAIVDALYAGDAEAAAQMMPPSLWGYNKAVQDYPHDPVKAKEHLDACLKEEELPEKVVFYVPPIQRFYYPKPKELGELIQAQLAEVGITTEIQSPEWGTVYIPDVRGGKAELFLLGWGGDNGDPDNYLCKFFCGASADFNSDGNFEAAEGAAPKAPDEALNTLLREAATLGDQAARAAKYEEANQMIHDLVPAVPLVHRTPPLVFRANVKGYTSSPIQTILTGVSKG